MADYTENTLKLMERHRRENEYKLSKITERMEYERQFFDKMEAVRSLVGEK